MPLELDDPLANTTATTDDPGNTPTGNAERTKDAKKPTAANRRRKKPETGQDGGSVDADTASGPLREWDGTTASRTYRLPALLLDELEERAGALRLDKTLIVTAGIVHGLDLSDEALLALVERVEEARDRADRARRRRRVSSSI